MALEHVTARPAPYHRQTHPWDAEEGITDQFQALLWRESPHIEHQQIVWVPTAQPLTECAVAWAWAEALRIDPTLPPANPCKTVAAQIFQCLATWAEVNMGLIVQ